MPLIKCSECQKEISDKATACPHCGCPTGQPTNTLVQLDSAPHKRKKYRQGFLIFAAMFFFGMMLALGNLSSGDSGKFALLFIIGLVGFIGMIASSIGSWLNKP